MAAPGDSLEFKEGAFLKSKARERSGLQDTVMAAIKNQPRPGKVVAGMARELNFAYAGQIWTVPYSLRGTDIGLLNVFGPGEEGRLESYKEELCELFKRGGKR